ncbi:dense granule protein GRA1 [Toxoplasma gondii RUB]|uniref:Dense granule protein 1 / major antigenp24 n=4 Tax=Toxoplasma gondii TaxID=5811 RepID=B9Q5Z2_TOXGV|nr:dense granule protein GRA1 [Toxoplasma gondii VEG]KFG52207.1 dense granule protein GRA1 [Toxoplasma gondii p89]KFG61589.1 dense granule protein GRA1 [Toxoplasma gondii RUB]PUA87859.1 dense granule protein GRA1 [Toxoplasma gondii TgCATBr9]CEL75338.1 TPA: dense granule protein 1 / major antigenp24 [Toxoplasma gondii VEG]
MVRVSAIVGAAASVFVCLSAGAYAAEGGDNQSSAVSDRASLLGLLSGGTGQGLGIGESVDLEMMGNTYRVERPTGNPDLLKIAIKTSDGSYSEVGDVNVEEVIDTMKSMQRDEDIFLRALNKGETVEEAIEDVAQAEGLNSEQTLQLEDAVSAVASVVQDEMKVIDDVQQLEKDKQQLKDDIGFLTGERE